MLLCPFPPRSQTIALQKVLTTFLRLTFSVHSSAAIGSPWWWLTCVKIRLPVLNLKLSYDL